MSAFKDLSGLSFGRLVVLACTQRAQRRVDGVKTHTLWECMCSCGTLVIVRSDNLLKGSTKSCGCLHKEVSAKVSTKHGLSQSSEYMCWAVMLQRCNNENNPNFSNYGGRGILVDQSWLDFRQFISDMGLKPAPNLTLERLDNNKGYCKENCAWVTHMEQTNNTRRTRLVCIDGKTQSVTQWCRELNLSYSVVMDRINRVGMSCDKALGMPTRAAFKEKNRATSN